MIVTKKWSDYCEGHYEVCDDYGGEKKTIRFFYENYKNEEPQVRVTVEDINETDNEKEVATVIMADGNYKDQPLAAQAILDMQKALDHVAEHDDEPIKAKVIG